MSPTAGDMLQTPAVDPSRSTLGALVPDLGEHQLEEVAPFLDDGSPADSSCAQQVQDRDDAGAASPGNGAAGAGGAPKPAAQAGAGGARKSKDVLVSVFRGFLRHKRGTSLRAWRLDLDVRGHGQIAKADFLRACTKLDAAIPQGGLVWGKVRGSQMDSTPLLFDEVDPAEAVGLENLMKALQKQACCDMGRAWALLDVGPRGPLGFLTLERFKAGLAKLDFEGDAAVLFHGLEGHTLGKLWPADLEYAAKVSRLARSRLWRSVGLPGTPLANLVSWVKSKEGADRFMERLTLVSRNSLGQPTISVGQLTACLTVMGFKDGAHEAATGAARYGDGVDLPADVLHCLLSGGYPRPHGGVAPPKVPRAPPRRDLEHGAGKARPVVPNSIRPAWDTGVDDFSFHNAVRCTGTRTYFNKTPLMRADDGVFGPGSAGRDPWAAGGQAAAERARAAPAGAACRGRPDCASPRRERPERPVFARPAADLGGDSPVGATTPARSKISESTATTPSTVSPVSPDGSEPSPEPNVDRSLAQDLDEDLDEAW